MKRRKEQYQLTDKHVVQPDQLQTLKQKSLRFLNDLQFRKYSQQYKDNGQVSAIKWTDSIFERNVKELNVLDLQY